jgi:dolichol-phosphate mannosyltransferase
MYDPYIRRRGAAFYVLAGMRLVKNPRYPEALEIQTSKVDAHPILESGPSLVETFMKNPDQLRFMNAETPEVAGRGLALSALSLERPEPFESLGELGAQKPNVTIVIPTMNEAEAIAKTIEEVKTEGYRNILVVDGYSTDGTADVARAMAVKVLYQHGCGKAGAVKMAIEHVETPYMLFIDGDYTYDPKDIWRLMNHSARYAHVIGVRDKKCISRLHRFGNWVISQTFSLLFGVKTTDVCSGMYLLETKEARKHNLEEPGFMIEIELAAQSASMGALTEVPIGYRPRIGTRKLNTWKHGLAILSAAFTLARRYNPVFLYSSLAGLAIIPAVSILGWVAIEQLTNRIWHSGWALVGIMFLLVASQAFTLASVSIIVSHTAKRLAKEVENLARVK